MTARTMHVYEVRPRKDKRGFDLISDALPFGDLWYEQPPDFAETESLELSQMVHVRTRFS
jgi:hypothetical protein